MWKPYCNISGTREQPLCLWIDAIYPNQDDEMGKAQQILVMGQIYREAKQVHIWLGLEDHMTPKLFAFFQKASQLSKMEQSKMAQRIVFLMQKFIDHDSLRAVCTLRAFFERPWFSRCWVIQEACLARRAVVHCGSCSIFLWQIAVASMRFQSLDFSLYLIKMATNLGKPMRKSSILELLWNFHKAGCLDPKDCVATLLGLVPDEEQFHLDYTVHWTELYKQVALFALDLSNNDNALLWVILKRPH